MKKPKLGQNFLIDEDACRRIAGALGDTTSRTVVEIGPGHGAITDILAPRCARLHCIEFDPALAHELAFRFRNDPHVTVHHADILRKKRPRRGHAAQKRSTTRTFDPKTVHHADIETPFFKKRISIL